MAKNLLPSCSCLDYAQHKIPCKHMYLVQRVHGLEIKYSADLVPNQEVVRNDGPFGPFLENTLSQHVLHQLQAARAENEATRKRNREEEIVALWRRLGIIACDPRGAQTLWFINTSWMAVGSHELQQTKTTELQRSLLIHLHHGPIRSEQPSRT